MKDPRFLLLVGAVVLAVSRRAAAQDIEISDPLGSPPSSQVDDDPPEEVSIRSKPPPRSASDWEVSKEVLQSSPKQDGADALAVVPGVFVTERSALGRAPRLSLRGFEGTSGQDVAIFLENIPLNQASNIRAPGYADMRLVMPEVIHSMRVSSGPYDPRQGDFAIAGTMRMELGLDQPGFTAKGTYGSFDTRRVFLGFAPEAREWRESFAAFEAYGTDGPGSGRAGERASFVGQLVHRDRTVDVRLLAALGSSRFDFPGYIDQRSVEHGLYQYSSRRPLGRDRTAQAHVGLSATWSVEPGTLAISAFGSKTSLAIRQDLTGYVLDLNAGLPPTHRDDSEQKNDATTLGGDVSFQRAIKLLSKADTLTAGAYVRLDTIDQKDTRLEGAGARSTVPVDASISAINIASYLDAALHPFRRLVVRGGPRIDSLSYSVSDRTAANGLERTLQGFHVGSKATADYALGQGVHVVVSYGEGFRSAQARTLREGDRSPFATVRSLESGFQRKSDHWRASLVGFRSWLSQDRVFDADLRENAPAPPSVRTGIATAFAASTKVFAASASATYTRAVFTGSDDRFRSGDAVPYAPRFVARADASITHGLGTLMQSAVVGKLGAGLEGAAGRSLPDGTDAKNAFFVDALASVAWREFELGVSGQNLLALRYYDAQYLYASNFDRGATLPTPRSNVLVAAPTTVLATLQVRLGGLPPRGGPDVY